MKVFISWSGELSKRLAGAIRDWLPTTLQYVKPYFTPADIEKGAKWDLEISKELEASNFCIIVLTRESLNSKWIMFEAGAISKSPGMPRLCTVLFGIEPTDVQGPLASFQATRFSKEDIHQLLKTINANAKEEALADATLDLVFDKWWPDLEQSVNKITSEAGSSVKPAKRSEQDLLEEIVGLSRLMAGQQSQLLKLLETSNQSRAMVNALLTPAPPPGVAGPSLGLWYDLLRQKLDTPPSGTTTTKSE